MTTIAASGTRTSNGPIFIRLHPDCMLLMPVARTNSRRGSTPVRGARGENHALSSFAQELTERIHRATRQRRLSVPSSGDRTGPTRTLWRATWIMSSIRCRRRNTRRSAFLMTQPWPKSRSVHQILACSGTRSRCLPRRRSRMYQLVKGRDSTHSAKHSATPAPTCRSLTKPINPDRPGAPRRPAYARFGPGIARASF